MKSWLCSDLHLGDVEMLKHRVAGFEHRILKAWDECVMPKDVVYILGDVATSRHAFWLKLLMQLPGEKVLLLGNQDQNRLKWYYKWGFVHVVPFNEALMVPYYLKPEVGKEEAYYGKIMLSHVPASESVTRSRDERFLGLARKFEKLFNMHGCILNVHGHTHGRANETHKTFDVTPEVIGEQLVTLDQVFDLKVKSL
jgi:calcineurin-like phosphoesterase family protein